MIEIASAKLLAAREQRVRPDCDRKHLVGWNALVIEAMARAGRALAREDWIDSAARAMHFIRAHLWRDGRLLACAVTSGERGDSPRREIAVAGFEERPAEPVAVQAQLPSNTGFALATKAS